MQCACALLSSVTCLALPYFSTLSHKPRDFFGVGEGGEPVEHKMCLLIFSTIFFLSEKFIILRRIERDMVMSVYCSSCKVPALL